MDRLILTRFSTRVTQKSKQKKMLRRNLKFIQKICAYRHFHASTRLQNIDNRDDDEKELTSSVATRFQVFKNESVGVIFDIEEERAKRRLEEETGKIEEDENSEEQLPSIYEGLNLERKLLNYKIHASANQIYWYLSRWQNWSL